MKQKFVFDELDDDILDIDEMTINMDTGVSAERICEKVMSNIDQKTPKKSMKKRIGITLVAAAAAAAVLGTATVAATGGFNPAFAEYFAGDCVDGIYSGSEIKINSDRVDIDFLGITGDDSNVIGLAEITNKYGSSFIDNPEDVFIGYDSTNACYKPTLWQRMTNTFVTISNTEVNYTFQDNKTLRLFFKCSDNGTGTPKGQTLEMQGGTIYAYRPVKTIYTPSKSDDRVQYEYDDNGNIVWDYPVELYDALQNEYASQLEQNQTITEAQDGGSIIIAETTEIKLDYTLSVKLNYKSSDSINFTADGASKVNIDGINWDFLNIEAQSFSLAVKIRTWEGAKLKIPFVSLGEDASAKQNEDGSYTVSDEYLEKEAAFHRYFDNLFSEMDITLKDGRTIKGKYNGGYQFSNNYCELDGVYQYYENGRNVAIDPSNIKSISYKGTIIAEV
ncbi:MAG: hypothetical protein IJ861_09345 [Clostridia bacterium]|nr:hypothetical protein [Clostridia bacterium]